MKHLREKINLKHVEDIQHPVYLKNYIINFICQQELLS